jgi:hypothetical protein
VSTQSATATQYVVVTKENGADRETERCVLGSKEAAEQVASELRIRRRPGLKIKQYDWVEVRRSKSAPATTPTPPARPSIADATGKPIRPKKPNKLAELEVRLLKLEEAVAGFMEARS